MASISDSHGHGLGFLCAGLAARAFGLALLAATLLAAGAALLS